MNGGSQEAVFVARFLLLIWVGGGEGGASRVPGMIEGRRISASPRPCSVRRVVASKKRPRPAEGFVNSVRKLLRREICAGRDRSFGMSNAQERFRHIQLQVWVMFFFFLSFEIDCLCCWRAKLGFLVGVLL